MRPSSITEHDRVVLRFDLPDEDLCTGDVGTVIHVHASGAAFEVEFFTLDGQTFTVATVPRDQLRPVDSSDVSHARPRS